MRQAFHRAASVTKPLELHVLNAVMSLVASYSRLEDTVAIRQLAAVAYGKPANEVTGYERSRVSAALLSLAKRDIVVYWSASGRYPIPTIGLPKAIQTPPGCGIQSSATALRSEDSIQRGKDFKAARACVQSSATGGHTEKSSEKTLRAVRADPLVERALTIWPGQESEITHAIEMLRGENIADTVIDEAIGQCFNRAMTEPVGIGYWITVTRSFYKQRTGLPDTAMSDNSDGRIECRTCGELYSRAWGRHLCEAG
jgi:hypothetical protein